ncbi:MAG TPA: YfhO family protein, partial [Chitinophagaceae bacterium]|nr:YfhO family protein [Chitinophagaceae bacterium]
GKIISSSTAAVVLLQNIYPRWKLYVDNQPQKIIKTNIAFMGFEVPNGEHQFSFQYQSSDLDIAFIVSTICILLLCIYKITEFRKKSV